MLNPFPRDEAGQAEHVSGAIDPIKLINVDIEPMSNLSDSVRHAQRPIQLGGKHDHTPILSHDDHNTQVGFLSRCWKVTNAATAQF